MAVVDFTNAKIEIVTSYQRPPFAAANVNLSTNYLTNSNGSYISNGTRVDVSTAANKFVFNYTGTFTADGTEFYIYSTTGNPAPAKWRVSNITFHSGDTYSFELPITINFIGNSLSDVPEDELIPTGD